MRAKHTIPLLQLPFFLFGLLVMTPCGVGALRSEAILWTTRREECSLVGCYHLAANLVEHLSNLSNGNRFLIRALVGYHTVSICMKYSVAWRTEKNIQPQMQL